VNSAEAKTHLLRYRPGTADAEDPQVNEALALAQSSPELARWLAAQHAGLAVLRGRFRQIAPPAGLKEQILSEFAASQRALARRRFVGVALALVLALVGILASLWPPRRAVDNPLALYQNRMVRIAMGGYAMDLLTNDPGPIRAYLAQHQAPADFALPLPLQHTALTGCAVRDWQGARVSLICFRTGKPLPPGAASDLWLFVVDRAVVANAPNSNAPDFIRISRLLTATWTAGNKLYFLGIQGGESDLKQFLL
jgi:hypothetical protein